MSRSMLQRLAFAALLGTLALLPLTALAGWSWCRSDPVIHVGNTQFTVNVAIDSTEEAHITGPVAYTFQITAGTSHVLDRDGGGFNGYGDTITWTTGAASGHLIISVTIPTNNGAQNAELSVQKGDGVPVIYTGTTSSLSANVTYP